MLVRRVVALILVLYLLALPAFAQNGEGDLLGRIRKEAIDRSQIMKTMHMLTDVYGPRLTGSPNHKAAAEWAIKQMTSWGLQNAHLEGNCSSEGVADCSSGTSKSGATQFFLCRTEE